MEDQQTLGCVELSFAQFNYGLWCNIGFVNQSKNW